MIGVPHLYQQMMVVFCLPVVLSQTQLGTRVKTAETILVTGRLESTPTGLKSGTRHLVQMEHMEYRDYWNE